MGTTAKGLRYPEPEDRLNLVHTYISNLATDVDAFLPTTWAALPLASGIAANTPAPQWRKELSDVIDLRGQVRKTDSTAWAANSAFTLGTLPTGARPAGVKLFACATSVAGQFARVSVATTGVITLDTPATSTFTVVVLDNITFDTTA